MSKVNIRIDDRRSLPPPEAGSAVEDLLAIAQQGALASNLAAANQVRNTDLARLAQAAQQQGMGPLRLAILAQAAGCLQTSPLEARAAIEVLSGNELAQTLADLRATLAARATPR